MHDPRDRPAAEGRPPQVVHCRRAPAGSFKLVDRTTLFGNPFRLRRRSDAAERVAVIERYRAYFLARVDRDVVFREQVEGLRGWDLGCHCAPQPCHAQVILDYLAATQASTGLAAGRQPLMLEEPRVLVCGSRDWPDDGLVWTVLDRLRARYGYRLVVIEGCTPTGATATVHAWCVRHELRSGSRHRCHPGAVDADPPQRRWRAGQARNTEMYLDRPRLVVAFHDRLAPDLSVGDTADSLLKAALLGIPAFLIRGRASVAPHDAAFQWSSTQSPQAADPCSEPATPDLAGGWFTLPADVPEHRLHRARRELRAARLLPAEPTRRRGLGLGVE